MFGKNLRVRLMYGSALSMSLLTTEAGAVTAGVGISGFDGASFNTIGRLVTETRKSGTGVYSVFFNRQVINCNFQATVQDGLPGYATLTVNPEGIKELQVFTWDKRGARADATVNVLATCPK